MGDYVKLWFLYPPSAHNLDIFYAYKGQEGKFLRLFGQLQDYILVLTTAQDIIYMPPGCLHSVYTIKGGLLLGLNWSGAKDIHIVSEVFRGEFYVEATSEYSYCFLFLRSLIATLTVRGSSSDTVLRK